jgi:steroid delta-isomerase-like uncharacterized protein
MSTETNKAIIARMVQEVWNEGRTDLVEEFFVDDYRQVVVGQPPATGLEVAREGAALTRSALPDFQLSIDELVAEGDRVAAHWTVTGTHEGDYIGIPATGKPVRHQGATFYRLTNGRIAEVWFLADIMGVMQQLGVIPAPDVGSYPRT